ncbi:hypothetical protein Ahy_B04g073425 [Arachis hypogaea]|uniref:Uncharacterized protein n=1 Tax=Arachis hypogaea TaxID=3818 RepID=A0A444ZQK8_ARAHY|nr:hypothetical protein Ahy_B04g073425 [Arachis hypogaea]
MTDVANALTNQQSFEELTFMRSLDLKAMHAPEIFEDDSRVRDALSAFTRPSTSQNQNPSTSSCRVHPSSSCVMRSISDDNLPSTAGSAAASSVPQVDGLIPPSGSTGAAPTSSLCPFRPPCTEPPPAPQTCTNGAQHSELPDEDLDPEADEVDSFEQHVDNLFAASEALKRKRRKTTEFWDVKTIDLTLEQNIKGRPKGITADHWRWFLDYRNSEEKKERIAEIEQHDESSRLLSQNDSLAQALGKEHPGKVRGMGIGPTTSQLFGTNSPQPSIGTQREEIQRVLLEL